MLSGFADEHVKAAIVEGLRLRDMDVVTAQERDQRQVDDEALLAVATGEGRLLLTNDTDFLRIHSRWLSDRRTTQGSCSGGRTSRSGLRCDAFSSTR